MNRSLLAEIRKLQERLDALDEADPDEDLPDLPIDDSDPDPDVDVEYCDGSVASLHKAIVREREYSAGLIEDYKRINATLARTVAAATNLRILARYAGISVGDPPDWFAVAAELRTRIRRPSVE